VDILSVIIIAVIEGITEFLPVSSTGHMILAARLIHVPQTEFLKSFEIVIQLGAILAVLSVTIKNLPRVRSVLTALFFSFLPSALIGAIFYGIIKSVLLDNTAVTLIALFLGGLVMIVFEKKYKPLSIITIQNISIPKAILIGLFQSLALIPGVSRSAATIIGAMTVGLTRTEAVIYSFALAIPTMTAAAVLDIFNVITIITPSQISILFIGLMVAFLSAYLTVNYFLRYVKSRTLIPFGVYRIILAAILGYLLL
jgi:undecaprenyl-diphosphatase